MTLDLRTSSFESNPLLLWALTTVKAAIPADHECISLTAYMVDLNVQATVHFLEDDQDHSTDLILEGEVSYAAFLIVSMLLTIHCVLLARFAEGKVSFEAHEIEKRIADEPWRLAGVEVSFTSEGTGISVVIPK